MEVVQGSSGFFISQRKYANELLERFGMKHCNPVKNPIPLGAELFKDKDDACVNATGYKQMVRSLMYITATRPDLAYAVSLVSRFMERPTILHQQAVKRVLHYLKETIEMGILYKIGGEEKLVSYSNSNYAGDVEDQKSTSGYVFLLSLDAVAWSSKKQSIVTLSTTEAEFVGFLKSLVINRSSALPFFVIIALQLNIERIQLCMVGVNISMLDFIFFEI